MSDLVSVTLLTVQAGSGRIHMGLLRGCQEPPAFQVGLAGSWMASGEATLCPEWRLDPLHSSTCPWSIIFTKTSRNIWLLSS